MLLQRLKEYEDRRTGTADQEDDDAPPEEYVAQAIPWIVSLDRDGRNPHFIRTSGGEGKRDHGKRMPIPYLKRSGTNIKPQLLADKAELALGFAAEDASRAARRHSDFAALVEACAQATHDERVRAVSCFLQQLALDELALPGDLTPNDFITFEVDGVRPVALAAVQEFWAKIAPKLGQRGVPALTVELICSWLAASDEGVQGQCIICGEQRTIARVHPVAIKLPRVVADQQVAIVAANRDASWSYGLEQSLIAPTCRPCAAAYAKGLNRLARDERTHVVVGDSIFLFWTRVDVGFDFYAPLNEPKVEQVQALISAVRTAKPVPEVDDTAFYATLLSGSGGRAVVRDWIDTTVGAVKACLVRWFEGQRIVDAYGEEALPLSIYWLARSTVREAKDLPKTTARLLLRAALTGAPLPRSLLYQAVRRSRAEQNITYQRAALIKLVLRSQPDAPKEDTMVALHPQHPEPAYHYGRLLAVLAEIQDAAIGKAAIIDRFYGTASSAPASVFARLLRGAQPHLSKLERDKPGLHYTLQLRLEEVMANITSFAPTLTLDQQGLFALGFYHQRAHDRAEMKAAAERKAELKAAE
jgi:CRISPR-associated protein Csd1